MPPHVQNGFVAELFWAFQHANLHLEEWNDVRHVSAANLVLFTYAFLRLWLRKSRKTKSFQGLTIQSGRTVPNLSVLSISIEILSPLSAWFYIISALLNALLSRYISFHNYVHILQLSILSRQNGASFKPIMNFVVALNTRKSCWTEAADIWYEIIALEKNGSFSYTLRQHTQTAKRKLGNGRVCVSAFLSLHKTAIAVSSVGCLLEYTCEAKSFNTSMNYLRAWFLFGDGEDWWKISRKQYYEFSEDLRLSMSCWIVQ